MDRTASSGHRITVLAIDTTSPVGSVALTKGDCLLGEYLLAVSPAHSEKILSMIDHLLKDSGTSLDAVDIVAVSSGPGSFTGLRVGISTAQGLALSLGKDLVNVHTLAAIAFQARGGREHICPMIDARRGEVYTALFRCSPAGDLEKLGEETVIAPEKWLEGIREPTVFSGSGACLYHEKIKALLGDTAAILPPESGIPRAATVARLALGNYLRDRKNELYSISPAYIRPADAELHAATRKDSFNPAISGKPEREQGP